MPIPIDTNKWPNLGSLKKSINYISKYIKKNDLIVLESTVYNGATKNILVTLLKKKKWYIKIVGVGYSPVRIKPSY